MSRKSSTILPVTHAPPQGSQDELPEDTVEGTHHEALNTDQSDALLQNLVNDETAKFPSEGADGYFPIARAYDHPLAEAAFQDRYVRVLGVCGLVFTVVIADIKAHEFLLCDECCTCHAYCKTDDRPLCAYWDVFYWTLRTICGTSTVFNTFSAFMFSQHCASHIHLQQLKLICVPIIEPQLTVPSCASF
jgi:hypothetical protein